MYIGVGSALLLTAAYITLIFPTAHGIGCYVCSSKNGSNINCEDPFHPGYSNYVANCQVGKRNHIGKFPASFCVKIQGTSNTGESLMIRICVLENMDNQCGLFKFEKKEMKGCISTCTDDGCNASPRASASPLTAALHFTGFLVLPKMILRRLLV